MAEEKAVAIWPKLYVPHWKSQFVKKGVLYDKLVVRKFSSKLPYIHVKNVLIMLREYLNLY